MFLTKNSVFNLMMRPLVNFCDILFVVDDAFDVEVIVAIANLRFMEKN